MPRVRYRASAALFLDRCEPTKVELTCKLYAELAGLRPAHAPMNGADAHDVDGKLVAGRNWP